MGQRRLIAVSALLLLVGALVGCASADQGSNPDPGQVDAVDPPEVGACRVLTPADVLLPANAGEVVDCAEPHTAETFEVGRLPAELAELGYDDRRLGEFVYHACGEAFEEFLGADESTVMRSIISWAWFRPSEQAWEEGARWYRCDVVGGGDQSVGYRDLPETAEQMLAPPPADEWMACAVGPTVAGAVKVPCSEPHDWRAISTIRLGKDEDPYPGDRLSEVRTRDFCSEQVGAWLNYPLDYDFGYTWFHEAEWKAGNRRSICWAKTDQ